MPVENRPADSRQEALAEPNRPPIGPGPIPIPDGARVLWTNVVLAAVLMLATMPGRTFGLGLINEPLLADLHYARGDYAAMNFWATLLGAAFCLPIGWLLDRCGLRWVSTTLVVLLGAVVWRMSGHTGSLGALFFLVLLTRGLGQSALSVASITAAGKSAGGRPGMAMSVYAVLFTVLTIAAFSTIDAAVKLRDWRFAWGAVAVALVVGIAPLVAIFLREPATTPTAKPSPATTLGETDSPGMTLLQALQTSAFWAFGGGIALFGLAISGLTFWNESVVVHQGFAQPMAITFIAWVTGFGLLGQFGCGWLSQRRPLPILLGAAMALYACGLAVLPLLKSAPMLVIAAGLFGISGGAITVVFFAIWSAAFGRAHLGRIQGAAQLLSVFASALGPWLFEKSLSSYHSYAPILLALAPLVLLFAVACWRVKLPAPETSTTK